MPNQPQLPGWEEPENPVQAIQLPDKEEWPEDDPYAVHDSLTGEFRPDHPGTPFIYHPQSRKMYIGNPGWYHWHIVNNHPDLDDAGFRQEGGPYHRDYVNGRYIDDNEAQEMGHQGADEYGIQWYDKLFNHGSSGVRLDPADREEANQALVNNQIAPDTHMWGVSDYDDEDLWDDDEDMPSTIGQTAAIASASQFHYHTSPRKNRESIMINGLRPNWDPEVDDEPGVFMTAQPDHVFAQEHGHDLWQVNTQGLDIKPDPWGEHNNTADELYGHVGDSWYSPQHVEPNRLTLLNSSIQRTMQAGITDWMQNLEDPHGLLDNPDESELNRWAEEQEALKRPNTPQVKEYGITPTIMPQFAWRRPFSYNKYDNVIHLGQPGAIHNHLPGAEGGYHLGYISLGDSEYGYGHGGTDIPPAGMGWFGDSVGRDLSQLPSYHSEVQKALVPYQSEAQFTHEPDPHNELWDDDEEEPLNNYVLGYRKSFEKAYYD